MPGSFVTTFLSFPPPSVLITVINQSRVLSIKTFIKVKCTPTTFARNSGHLADVPEWREARNPNSTPLNSHATNKSESQHFLTRKILKFRRSLEMFVEVETRCVEFNHLKNSPSWITLPGSWIPFSVDESADALCNGSKLQPFADCCRWIRNSRKWKLVHRLESEKLKWISFWFFL